MSAMRKSRSKKLKLYKSTITVDELSFMSGCDDEDDSMGNLVQD